MTTETAEIQNKKHKQKTERERKRILWTIICQQIGQPRKNGQVSTNIQSTNTESRRNSLNRPITRRAIESVINITNSLKTKVQNHMDSLGNSTKHTKKNVYQFFSNSSKRLKRRKHFHNHFMKSPLSLYQNQTKTLPKKEN